MKAAAWLAVAAGLMTTLALAATLGVWSSTREAIDPLGLHDQGIGPLALGKSFDQAQQDSFRARPVDVFAGIGCGGLDEIRYAGQLGDHPVSIMGMARNGRLTEIEITLDSPVQATDQAACLHLRDRFAAPFVEHFNNYRDTRTVRLPVSTEFEASTGPATLIARWFPAGRSCYISAVFLTEAP